MVELAAVVALTISGGFELHSNDYGRPVPLYASMLGVPPKVFRQAFSGVHPDPGHDPSTEDQQANKDALMSVLGPYGVTNDELDRVANYYRFDTTKGQTWRHRAAKAVVTVRNGKIVGVRVTDPGTGYTYTPQVSVRGFSGALKVRVVFTKRFGTNGHLRIALK
jgi:hypothetical protein